MMTTTTNQFETLFQAVQAVGEVDTLSENFVASNLLVDLATKVLTSGVGVEQLYPVPEVPKLMKVVVKNGEKLFLLSDFSLMTGISTMFEVEGVPKGVAIVDVKSLV